MTTTTDHPLVGKTVRRYAVMHPRRYPAGLHKVKSVQFNWSASKDTVVWLENFVGPVHIDAVEEVEVTAASPEVQQFIDAVRPHLTPDLLKDGFQGHCYIFVEAIYHRFGGKDAGLKPMNLRHEGVSHWWLVDQDGNVIDPTAGQFETPVPYDQGRGRGFLTKQPSARAQSLMFRADEDLRAAA